MSLLAGKSIFLQKKIKYFKEIQILGGLNFPWDKTSLALPSPEEATLLCVQPTRRRSSSSISLPRQAFFPQIPAWQRETTWCPRLTDRTRPCCHQSGSVCIPSPAQPSSSSAQRCSRRPKWTEQSHAVPPLLLGEARPAAIRALALPVPQLSLPGLWFFNNLEYEKPALGSGGIIVKYHLPFAGLRGALAT